MDASVEGQGCQLMQRIPDAISVFCSVKKAAQAGKDVKHNRTRTTSCRNDQM
jgi:hypothetical protein